MSWRLAAVVSRQVPFKLPLAGATWVLRKCNRQCAGERVPVLVVTGTRNTNQKLKVFRVTNLKSCSSSVTRQPPGLDQPQAAGATEMPVALPHDGWVGVVLVSESSLDERMHVSSCMRTMCCLEGGLLVAISVCGRLDLKSRPHGTCNFGSYQKVSVPR